VDSIGMAQARISPPSRHALADVLVALYDIARHRDAVSFPGHVARILARALGADSAAYVLIDPDAANAAIAGWPDDAFTGLDTTRACRLHEKEHPLAARLSAARSAHAWNLHDLVAPEAFRKTALHRELYKALGIEYQLVMLLPGAGPGAHAISLHRRHAPFGEEDRELLELLWPNLAQAIRNLRALSRARESSTVKTLVDESGIVVLDRTGNVELCTEQARLWLTRYCPEGFPRRKLDLPATVAGWVQAQLREVEEAAGAVLLPAGNREKLILTQGESFLSVNLIIDHGRGQHLLVLEEESLRAPPSTLSGMGLTARETEVLTWVAQGKTNPEIGLILGMSGRTVQKHLEHVFEKLGVESRTGAILKAWQAGRFASLLPR
jgi:DNA-binding CsgD family transcriptional regulator